MLLKTLLIIAVIAAVYFFFIKSKPSMTTKKSADSDAKAPENEMVACAACDTYVSVDDAFIKAGKYYCSQACMHEGE